MSALRVLGPWRISGPGPVPGRVLALAGVVLAHAGLLAFIVGNRPTPAAVMAPPAVIGVLVSEHNEPVAAPPVPPQAAHRPVSASAPVRELPPSERAPVSPPPAPSVAPVAAAEAPAAPAAPASPAAIDSSGSGPVTPPRSDAAHLNNPKPVYPAVSRRLKEEGTVVLEVFIQVDGSVGELRVKRSSGFPRLDEAALAAVRRWTYVPARRGSEALALWHSQSLVFSLLR
ncbi:MAG: energy transducer TonB [Pseudomonadota bacterium]